MDRFPTTEPYERSEREEKAYSLGAAFRRSGASINSSPYEYRGRVLDASLHRAFRAGWADEDMSILGENNENN